MCGLAGIIGIPGVLVDTDLLGRFSRLLRHRGPDDVGFLGWDGGGPVRVGRDPREIGNSRIAFVHRRLAIIDVSENGWQPMASADGRYHIVFNGEIYNFVELRAELEQLGYRFRSRSDTEVLLNGLRQWGVAALPRLNGMFAFALLDRVGRKMVLARDAFGIKPLYYSHTPQGLVFASEIGALLEAPGVGRGASAPAVYEYLRYGRTDSGGSTLFASVRQLPAAHYAVVDVDDVSQVHPARYWDIGAEASSPLRFDAAAEKLRELFLESVRLHLRSDVAVGAALSGGVDSSAIVMAARSQLGPEHELRTFGFVSPDQVSNEEPWIDMVAGAAGTRSHKTSPGPAALLSHLDELIRLQGEPFASTSILAQHEVYRLARESDTKVTLDGQGADELLGGYPTFIAARSASLIRAGAPGEAMALIDHAAKGLGVSRCSLWARVAGHLLPPATRPIARRLIGERAHPLWMNSEWFLERGVTGQIDEPRWGKQILRAQLHRTLTRTSLPALLRYADRNSMTFSVESRVPFLSVPLVEFIFSLPESHLIGRDGTTKAVFREAMRGLVPGAILARREKIGFVTPERDWLGQMADWVDDALSACVTPVLNRDLVRRDWRALVDGASSSSSTVWRWVNFNRWAAQFEVSFGE